MIMNDTMYKVIRFIAVLLLPGLSTLYFTLSTIWGLPYGEQIVGTLSALDVFLGGLLEYSKAKYDATKADDE